MKRIAVALAMLLCVAAAFGATWTLSLYDTGGNGWESGTIALYVNGVIAVPNCTLPSGSGPIDFTFSVVQGDQITTTYNIGFNPLENWYIITNHSGQVVDLHGAGGPPAQSIVSPLIAVMHWSESYLIGLDNYSGGLPVDPSAAYSYSQSVFLNSEIPLIGGIRRISQLGFRWDGASDPVYTGDITVWIGNTSRSYFESPADWQSLASMQQVYSGFVDLEPVNEWIYLYLDTPFLHNGVSNLIMAVQENTPGADYDDGRFVNSLAWGSYRSLQALSENYINAASPPAGSLYQSIPNISIRFDPYIHPPCAEYIPQATFPSYWTQTWSSTVGSNRWSVSPTGFAGGSANEFKATWTNQTGTTRLVSSPIALENASALRVSFKHRFEGYTSGATAKLQYSTNLYDWTDSGWSASSGAGTTAGTAQTLITGLSSYFYLAWTIEGNLSSFYFWYVDDIILEVDYYDAAVLSVNLPEALPPGEVIPRATILNSGNGTREFNLLFSIPGVYSSTQSVTLAAGCEQEISFAPFTPALHTSNAYTVSITSSFDANPANNQLSGAYVCVNLDTQAYAWNSNTMYFFTFNLSQPDARMEFGFHPLHLAASDWVDNTWLAVDSYDVNLWRDFLRIDPDTGEATYLGFYTDTVFLGLAHDAIGDILYATSGSSLYSVNKASGAGTLIGPHGGNPALIGLAYDNTNRILYGIGTAADALYRINPATGAATLAGPLGVDLDPNQGADCTFDQENGYIFMTARLVGDNDACLFWVDAADGQAWKVGSILAGYVDGFAIPYLWDRPTVSISPAGVLSWRAVPEAMIYLIYSATEPTAAFTPRSFTYSTTWQDPAFPEARRFYRVASMRAGRPASPIEYQSRLPLHR